MRHGIHSRLGLSIVLALNTGLLTACGPGFTVDPRIDVATKKLYSTSPASSKVYLASKSREANVVLNRLMDEAVPANDGADPLPQENNAVVANPVCPNWTTTADPLGPHSEEAEPPRGWSWLSGSAIVPGLQWDAVGQAHANDEVPAAEPNYRENLEERLKTAIAKIEDLISQIEAFDASALPQEIQDMKTCLLKHFNQILTKLQDRLATAQGADVAGPAQPQFTKAQCEQLITLIGDNKTPQVLIQFLQQFVDQRCQNPT